MSTIGNTNTPNGSFNDYLGGLANTLAIQVTMPAGGGTITSVSAYFAGHGGTITARVCIWDSSGNLLAQSSDMSVTAGSGGITGQAFQTGNVGGSSGYLASSGQVLRIGLWVHENQAWEWTENAGGTEYQATDNSNTAPVTPTTFTSVTGTPSIYATYSATTAATARVRRSGGWTASTSFSVRRSGVWVAATSVSVRRSGAWVAAT